MHDTGRRCEGDAVRLNALGAVISTIVSCAKPLPPGGRGDFAPALLKNRVLWCSSRTLAARRSYPMRDADGLNSDRSWDQTTTVIGAAGVTFGGTFAPPICAGGKTVDEGPAVEGGRLHHAGDRRRRVGGGGRAPELRLSSRALVDWGTDGSGGFVDRRPPTGPVPLRLTSVWI